jgi:hypothetical protein
MFATNNTIKVEVGKALVGTSATAYTAATQITDPGATGYIKDGEIVVLGMGGTGTENSLLTSGSTAAQFPIIQFVQRSGDKLVYSPKFPYAYATATYTAHSGPLDQVSTVGYNGTSGSINVLNNNNYIMQIVNTFDDKLFAEQLSRKVYGYQSSQSETQANIAKNFTDQINGDNQTFEMAERTGDGTPSLITNGIATSTALVTNGSNLVTFWTNTVTTPVTSTLETIATGAYLNLPSSNGRTFTYPITSTQTYTVYVNGVIYTGAFTNSNGVTQGAGADLVNQGNILTASVSDVVLTLSYKDCKSGLAPVVYGTTEAYFMPATTTVGDAVSVTYGVATGGTAVHTITLDSAWVGATGYIALESNGTTTIAQSNIGTTTNTNYGIKITGLPLVFKRKGLYPYKRVTFDPIVLQNWGSTTVSATPLQAMVPGTGVYPQVSDLEWFSLGGDGIRNFMWHPIPDAAENEDAIPCAPYDVITVHYTNVEPINVISGVKPSQGQVYLFLQNASLQGTSAVNTYANQYTNLYGILHTALNIL